MNTRYLLYLSAHQLVAHRWHSGALTREATFAPDGEGLRRFADYLGQRAECVFSILANVAEEGFHLDTIPLVGGADRAAIIQRKLAQLYANSALSGAVSLGTERTQRKNERIMFAALTHGDFFAPWLACLHEQRIALAGLYALPFLGPQLLARLKLDAAPCLLLSIQDNSIRQSYLENGELQFSRLIPLNNRSIVGIAQAFAGEALKMQQYLGSQRLLGRDQPITAHLLAHPRAFEAIRGSCVDSEALRFKLLDIEDCARRIGMSPPPEDSQCEALFLHLLANSPPRMQFAGNDLRHDYRLGKISQGLLAAGTVVLLAGLGTAGTLTLETHRLTADAARQHGESAQLRRQYEALAATMPPISISYDSLRRLMDRHTELERKSGTPHRLYRDLSHALDAAPGVAVLGIDWDAAGNIAGKPAPGDGETAVLRGRIELPANATPRQVFAVLDTLVNALKARAGLQVEVLKRPFDLESGKPLKGGDTPFDDATARTFAVQVSRKLTP